MMVEMFDFMEDFYKVVDQVMKQNEALDVEGLDIMTTYMGKLKQIYADLFENLGEVQL